MTDQIPPHSSESFNGQMTNRDPLRILMIAPTSFFSDYGGHIRIYEEALALQKRGHEVTIVTYYKGRDVGDLDIRRTAPLPYRTDYEVGSSRHKLAFDLYLAIKSLRVMWTIRPDIIHGHMHEGALIGGVLSRLFRKPLVFDFQGSLSAEMADHGFVKPRSLPHRAIAKLETWITRLPHITLTSTTRARDQLHKQFGVRAEKIVPLPDCVDMGRFDAGRFSAGQKAELLKELGIAGDTAVIGYLGLLTDYQGIPDLLHAATLFKKWEKNAHFLIMGYPNVEKYQAEADRLGVSDIVTFTGKIHYDYAPLYLSLSDVTVSAKMSTTEGCGKLLNYMALGKPVVAYDNVVHREYLGEWGVYPSAGDAGELAVALARLVDDGAYRGMVGEKLRERARDCYSWEAAANTIELIYRGLAGV